MAKTKLDKIEEKALKLFYKNMKYLKKKNESLYEKLNVLSEAFEQKVMEPQYELEYINDEFNVLNIETNNYLYPNGAKQYSKDIKKQQNYKHESGFNTLNEYAYLIQEDTKVEENIKHLKKTLVPYNSYINKNMPTSKENKEFIFIKKFIALGTLLGYHLDEVYDFFKLKQILIIEPNLEIFRLSLFTYDYKKLSKKCMLFFSVSEDNTTSHAAIESFLTMNYTHNYFIKFHIVTDAYKEYFQYVAGVLQYMSPFNFDYLRMLRVARRTSRLMHQNYNILSLKNNEKMFKDLPVLVLASGPSLKYSIEWLEKNQNKFILLAVAGCIPRLTKHNIKPDIIASLDAYDKVKHRFEYIEKKDLDKCVTLLSSMSDPSTIDVFKKEKVFIYEVLSNLKLQSSVETLTATNIGEMSFALMLILGVENLYLLGTDAAFDKETGASHDEVTAIGGLLEHDTTAQDLGRKNSGIDMMDVVMTKGNFRETVKTTRLFYNSVLGHGRLAELYKGENQTIYNLSDGAYYRYTEPLRPEDIDFKDWKDIDKEELHTYLEDQFNKNSTTRATLLEKRNLTNQIEFIENLISAVEDFRKMKNIKKYDDFEKMRISVAVVLCESTFDNVSYLSKVFASYFQIVESYINYFFNDKELKNVKKHINKIHKIWTKEVLIILKEYKDALEISIK